MHRRTLLGIVDRSRTEQFFDSSRQSRGSRIIIQRVADRWRNEMPRQVDAQSAGVQNAIVESNPGQVTIEPPIGTNAASQCLQHELGGTLVRVVLVSRRVGGPAQWLLLIR
jgi:hypothetical protein